MPLPHRLRLLWAAKRVERVGGDAGAVLCPRVVMSQSLVMAGKSFLAERERFVRMAGGEE
jgi:hypothetical protein